MVSAPAGHLPLHTAGGGGRLGAALLQGGHEGHEGQVPSRLVKGRHFAQQSPKVEPPPSGRESDRSF